MAGTTFDNDFNNGIGNDREAGGAAVGGDPLLLERRQFLRLTVAGAAGAIVARTEAGRWGASGDTEPDAADSPMAYSQAPEFDGRSDLLPVEERLPVNPRVIRVKDEIGTYGGTWGRAQQEGGSPWGPVKLLEENAIKFEINDEGEVDLVVNTIESWEANEDATEYTFHMREGLKWSDGEPFTTEDIQFWYDEYYTRNMMGAFGFLKPDETDMQLEVVDDYTYKTIFAAPVPLLPLFIAKQGVGILGGPTMGAPAHYLSQYIEGNPNENPDLIAEAIEREGVASWLELHGTPGDNFSNEAPISFFVRNPELPTLHMYTMNERITDDPFTMSRNPYYYVVDEEGQQLPYIDEVIHRQFGNQEVFNLQIAQGQIDMQERYTNPADFTFYKENEEAGDYTVALWRSARTWSIYPNIAHEDEVLRELLDTADFRQAMSIALNREEINSLIYDGLLTVRQASPVTGSPDYNAEWATKWIEYDPEGARALLDGMGLETDSDGFYLRPDGDRIRMNILHHFETGTSQADEVEKIAEYLQAIGLDVHSEPVSQDLETERIDANQVDIGYFWCDRSSYVMPDPGRYTGQVADGPWAAPYYRWLSEQAGDPVSGIQIEPPADHPIRQIFELWQQVQRTGDEAERNALFQEMLGVHAEAPFIIGTVGEDPKPVIVANSMRNVVTDTIQDDSLRDINHTKPMTYFVVG